MITLSSTDGLGETLRGLFFGGLTIFMCVHFRSLRPSVIQRAFHHHGWIASLFGISIGQVLYYFRHYHYDKRVVKSMVRVVCLVRVVESVLTRLIYTGCDCLVGVTLHSAWCCRQG